MVAWVPVAAAFVGFGFLIWSCRGGLPGVPVADDYGFLHQVLVGRALDLFDSMGAAYYWRPLSRQVWFPALGRWALDAPWMVAAAHLALLAATFALVYRLARRAGDRWMAAAVATFVVVSLPARALLVWPSGAQHLLGGALALLAVHETVAGRWAIAALAAAAGVASHESAALALVAMPLIAWARARGGKSPPRDTWNAAGIAALIGVVWIAGYAHAVGRGVVLPPRTSVTPGDVAIVLGRAAAAAFHLEDLDGTAAPWIAIAYGTVALAWIALLRRAAARASLRRRLPWVLLLAAAFVGGAVPLAGLLPDWNSWRAWVPMMALTAATIVAVSALSAPLALAMAGVKLAAILLAPPADRLVSGEPPATASDLSYPRITRLQRIADDTRRALRARYPHLPSGAVVRYCNVPRMAEVAFGGSRALRTWYRDPTLIWGRFGGVEGFHQRTDALVEFDPGAAPSARVIEPASLAALLRGVAHLDAGRHGSADALLSEAAERTTTRGIVYGLMLTKRARAHLGLGDLERAAIFNDQAMAAAGETPEYWAIRSWIFRAQGQRELALDALLHLRRLEPASAEAQEIARSLGGDG